MKDYGSSVTGLVNKVKKSLVIVTTIHIYACFELLL